MRFLTRFGFDVISSSRSWNHLVFVTYKCKRELSYIKENLSSLEGHTFSKATPKKALFARFFASDASGIGLGTIELTGEGGFSLIQQVAFTREEMSGP